MNKSFGYYCVRYVGNVLIVTLVVIAMVYAAYTFVPDLAARFIGGNSGTGIVTLIVPALLTAQLFYKHEQRRMRAGEGWLMAVVFTVLAFVVSGIIYYVGTLLVPMSAAEKADLAKLWNGQQSVLLTIAAIFGVFLILINKLMLWSGVRGAIKSAERAAAKSDP